MENYNANQGIYKTVNTGRQALLRITNDIRTAQSVALEGDETGNASSECSIILSTDDNVTYKYDSTDNTLYYITNDDTSDPDYKLCENVTAMTFNRTTVPDDSSAIRRANHHDPDRRDRQPHPNPRHRLRRPQKPVKCGRSVPASADHPVHY
ncbi:MAG: hypothetical protein ACYTER_09705 [Planctomycetota bacterium]